MSKPSSSTPRCVNWVFVKVEMDEARHPFVQELIPTLDVRAADGSVLDW
jgi:hypothetical protein